VRSLVVWAALYGLLSIPWPGLGHAFTTVYAAAAEVVLTSVLPMEGTSFRATEPGEPASEWDLAIRLPRAPGATSIHGIRIHLRRVAYVPLAFLAALGVAFPPARSARWPSVVACPVILVTLQTIALLSVFTTRGLLDLTLVGNVIVGLLSRAFFEAPGMGFAIPALLWALLARPFEGLGAMAPWMGKRLPHPQR
jgi:hypothetical protein